MNYSSQELRELINQQEAVLRAPGTVLFSQARYEIIRVLGEGGMGITCLAHEYSAGNLKRPVVLKFVKDSLDPQRLALFLNEVSLSIVFNHPNLVPIFRLESETVTVELQEKLARKRSRSHTVYFAVMQYIDGWNLRQIMDRLRDLGMALNYDLAMFILGRVARGLHYVHEYKDESGECLGLVHRDVSPENILIDRFGRVKVADFGIAKPMKRAQSDVWLMAGKLLYSSPEQIDGADLDSRSDIYNIGLLMYFMFTNRERFAREAKLTKVRERIRRKMTRSVLPDLTHLPPRLAQICDACLRENPNERYQSCEDLGTDIDIYFQETQKVLTNEQLEETLHEVFSDRPRFVSRRFIPLTGSPNLKHPDYDPNVDGEIEEARGNLPTVKLDEGA